MDLDIKVDEVEEKIFAIVDGQECVINFRREDGVLDLYRTFVPVPLRGLGIAQKLADFALKYALSENNSVRPNCSYIESYIEKHPEWKKLVAL